MYRSIWCSEWCELKTGCVMKSEVRTSAGGSAGGAVEAISSSALKPTPFPSEKASQTPSMSASEVVSSHESVSCVSESLRKLSPAAWPASTTASAEVPAGGVTQTVSKKGASDVVQPSLSSPDSSSAALVWQCVAISLSPSGPWYMP